MREALISFSKLFLGSVLVILGIIGLFVPILQGALFLFIGFALLSSESKWVRGKLKLLQRRFPRQAARMRALRMKLLAKWRKIRR